MKILGIEFAPLNVPLERRLQTFAVWQFTLSFMCFGFGFLFFFIYLLFTRFYYIPLLYLAWYIYDHKTSARGGRRILWARNWKIWKHYCNYFPLKLHKTVDLDPAKNYIFACHPHGVMCISHFGNYATEGTNFSKMFPGIRPYLLVLAGQFMFPVFREYFMMTGVAEISKESINYLLTQPGTGNALAIMVGGAVEALDAKPGMFRLKMLNRKGFCKLALRYGADICPVFTFGENDLFNQIPNPDGSFLRKIQNQLTHVFGFSLPAIHGRGMFQYTFGVTPYRRRMDTVVGRPIEVAKVENPSQEQIDKLHGQYMDALVRLFESNKRKYNVDEDKHLIFH
ncbi:2-acylglycerol O-acyltransferase 2-like [Gigantopelta aegis]|uniref:2-acylglycerol O-acyltransferase 2-like n=1 Tax=Gigantopelta aegis TaxID=1735272 RepID=UPI001B88E3EC|nr:2-acylglycerol O-acyltransferase 2-like [Gigantopelta aegis]